MAMSTLYGIDAFTLLGSGIVAYVLLTVFYRLFLHPLRKIPGPKLAALTWAYEIYYDVILPGQYNFKLQELHKQYGPILRVNPDEVHIADREYLGELYDARKRNKLPEHSLDIESSVAGTAEWELHKKRRHSMISFFSPKAVQELEPLLLQKRAMLLKTIDANLEARRQGSSQPLNVSDLYFAYCWDIIHEYAFALNSNLLNDLPQAHRLRTASNDLLLQVNYTRHFRWINFFAAFLPASIGAHLTPPGVADIKRNSDRVRVNVSDVLNDTKTTSTSIQTSSQHRSIFYVLRDDPSLPLPEKQPLRLAREGNFLVVAGSDSPARAIATTHFHLLDNPATLSRLRAELAPLGPEPTLADLEHLPYLNACILEGNRLSFGLTRRMLRIAPEDDLIYSASKSGLQHVIPAGTPLAISSLAVHTDESVFPDAWKFKPERWLEGNGKELRRYMMSFGAKGPRSCLGVHLAEAELRLAIAGVVGRYAMGLKGTTIRDVEYRHDFQMAFGNLDSQGVVVELVGLEGGE